MRAEKLEDRMVRKCPSHECKDEFRNYDFIRESGVPWCRKFVYRCRKCGYTIKIPVVMPDDRGRI
jgi:hypothetical protein